MRKSFILLDRDGVINQDSDAYIKSPDEWVPIPKSLEAIALLKNNGCTVVVVTNQSGVGRGFFDLKTLDAIHKKMHAALAAQHTKVDGIFFCPHIPEDLCDCRKPKPGLLKRAAQLLKKDFSDAMCIGGSLRDIQAGQAVQCDSFLVRTGKGQTTEKKHPELSVPIFDDLFSAAQFLLHG